MALLCTAIWMDITTHRIPNKTVVLGMGLAGAFSLLPNGIGFEDAAMGWVVGLACFLPLYAVGILGAGDVKLLAMVGMFIGYPAVLIVAIYTVLTGGVMAMLIAVRYQKLQEMCRNLYQGALFFYVHMTSPSRPTSFAMTTLPYRLPYALAITFGTLAYVSLHTSFFI